MNKMIIIPAIAVSAIIMGSALANAKPNRLRKFTDEKKELFSFIYTKCYSNVNNNASRIKQKDYSGLYRKTLFSYKQYYFTVENDIKYYIEGQADYLPTINIFKINNEFIEYKNNASSYPFSKIVFYGLIGEAIGGVLGFSAGIISPYPKIDNSDDLTGVGYALRKGLIGAGIGATLGCGLGVYNGAKKYKKNTLLPAIGGAFILPSIVAIYAKNKNVNISHNSIWFIAIATPVLSTTSSYLFSDSNIIDDK